MSEVCLTPPICPPAPVPVGEDAAAASAPPRFIQDPADRTARLLIPDDYLDEPADLPALQLIWVPELGQYAIVRFYAEKSGATGMLPLEYLGSRSDARRRLAVLRRMLARAVPLRCVTPAEAQPAA